MDGVFFSHELELHFLLPQLTLGTKELTEFFSPASETLSVRKESEPGEESLKSENDDSLHLSCDDRDPDKSAASLATDSSLLVVNNKDPSTLNKSKSSSVIPEPPSSPSLVSLSDEDDEFTPSLGLDNNDLVIKLSF